MYNETVKIVNYVMKYPNLLIKKIVEDNHTEEYANIAFNLILVLFIIIMFFSLLIFVVLTLKGFWVILQGICFWVFRRDTLKEFLIKQKADDRQFLKELFKHFEDEITKTINKNKS